MDQSAEVNPSPDVVDRPGRLGRPARYDELPRDTSLAGWGRVFFGHGGPRLLAGCLVLASARRVRLGGWRPADAAVAAGVVAVHPFAEWLIHVHLLHRPPRRRGGRVVDLRVARFHRQHHQDPRDIDLVFVPLPELTAMVGGFALAAAAARDRRRGGTGLVVALGSLLVYEWVHFLIHSPHRPRRARQRAHRLHHFRNERYWFGVVGMTADRVLGTAPERGDVPLSPTARTLVGA